MKVEMGPGLPNLPIVIGVVRRLIGRKEDLNKKRSSKVGRKFFKGTSWKS